MTSPNPFAVLQKDAVHPTAGQLKRAFRSFSNLTDADAVRLAAEARGILMRHLGHDAARALQSALFAEGLQTVLVNENDLPKLPEGRLLHKMELAPDELRIFDLLGRPEPIAWKRLGLIAAAAVQHVDIVATQVERSALRFSPFTGLRLKTSTEAVHRLEPDTQLRLELLLDDGSIRLQVHGEEFPFGYLIDRPEWSAGEKFIWFIRQISAHAPHATANSGVQQAVQTGELPVYRSRQSLTDEIVWLLWRKGHGQPV